MVLLLLAAYVLAPTAAQAHAVLLRARPEENARLATAPDGVVLEFNEAVTPITLEVADTAGRRVDVGEATSGAAGHEVRTDLAPDLPVGAYVVNWRVVSADGHPVSGAYVFIVGEAGAPPADLVMGEKDLLSDGFLPWAGRINQGLMYMATLLASGTVFFLQFVQKNRDKNRPPAAGVGRMGALVAAGLTLFGFGLQAAQTSVAAALASPLAYSGLVRLAGLAMLYFGLAGMQRFKVYNRVAWAGALLAAASFALTGHAVTADPASLRIIATAIHLWAAAAWFGGLVLLGLNLRKQSPASPSEAGGLVARFSSLAAVAAWAVLAAGLFMSWIEVQSFEALWSTPFGLVLTAKIVLVLVVLAVALYNNRRLVPRLTGGDTVLAARRAILCKTVAAEVIGLGLAILATGFLVGLTPPRNIEPDLPVTAAGPFAAETIVDGEYHFAFRVDPAEPGENLVELTIKGTGTTDAMEAEEVRLRLEQPEAGIGPIRVDMARTAGDTFAYRGPVFAVAGTWTAEVRVRLGTFTEKAAIFYVPIGP